MMFGSSKGGGQCFAIPDVCKTPTPGGPVPIPYPNIAMVQQASSGSCSSKVKIMGQPACTIKTEIPMSSGDEPGTLGGVVSNKFKGPAKFKKGSSKVTIEGAAAAYMTSMAGQNGGSNANAMGMQVAPSQAKVFWGL